MAGTVRAISKADFIWAINEWWRRYIENPEQFTREFQAVETFKRESRGGAEPSAGQRDFDFMCFLLSEKQKGPRKGPPKHRTRGRR